MLINLLLYIKSMMNILFVPRSGGVGAIPRHRETVLPRDRVTERPCYREAGAISCHRETFAPSRCNKALK